MSDQHKPTVGELADEIEAAYHELPFDYDRMRFKLWLREKINAALAAEREKCQQLVEALKEIAQGDIGFANYPAVAKAALAKVGK